MIIDIRAALITGGVPGTALTFLACFGTGVLAYTLGIRHAFDADHIAGPAPPIPHNRSQPRPSMSREEDRPGPEGAVHRTACFPGAVAHLAHMAAWHALWEIADGPASGN